MTEILEAIQNYIKPELLGLIPILNYSGYMFKKSNRINNDDIPLLNALVGFFIAGLYVVGSSSHISTYHDVCMGLFMSITQGGLCAAAAWAAHYIYKSKLTTTEKGEAND